VRTSGRRDVASFVANTLQARSLDTRGFSLSLKHFKQCSAATYAAYAHVPAVIVASDATRGSHHTHGARGLVSRRNARNWNPNPRPRRPGSPLWSMHPAQIARPPAATRAHSSQAGVLRTRRPDTGVLPGRPPRPTVYSRPDTSTCASRIRRAPSSTVAAYRTSCVRRTGSGTVAVKPLQARSTMTVEGHALGGGAAALPARACASRSRTARSPRVSGTAAPHRLHGSAWGWGRGAGTWPLGEGRLDQRSGGSGSGRLGCCCSSLLGSLAELASGLALARRLGDITGMREKILEKWHSA
jgi:hypothetical protein